MDSGPKQKYIKFAKNFQRSCGYHIVVIRFYTSICMNIRTQNKQAGKLSVEFCHVLSISCHSKSNFVLAVESKTRAKRYALSLRRGHFAEAIGSISIGAV